MLGQALRALGLGQREQLRQRAGQAFTFGRHDAGGLMDLIQITALSGPYHDACMPLQSRDGSTELVRCVGYESLLLFGRLLGASKQSVERGRQPAELVGRTLAQPAVELVTGNVIRLAPH